MNIPLEYNLLGLAIHRNYPEERFWQIVRNTGNLVIFGVDAHRPEQFADRQTLELAKKQCEGMNLVEQLTLTDVRANDKITVLCCVSTGKERKWQKSKRQ